MIIVLTGESGCGKTTLCQHIVTTLKARDVNVAGVLTPPRHGNGKKIGMDVEDVRTGQCYPLAERAAISAGTANLSWKFNDVGLARGTEILRAARPCDVLVVDELGPLELIRNEGWSIALDVLQAEDYRDALVVVRPSLLENFRARLKLELHVLTVTPTNREELARQIVGLLDSQISAHPRE